MGYSYIGNEIYYDDDTHTYKVGGVRLPSVTTIINWKHPIPDFKLKDPEFQLAMKHGTEVHDAISCMHQKIDPPPFFTDGIPEKVERWEKFLSDHVNQVVDSEFGVRNSKFGYCGRVDILAELNDGRFCCIDIKTGSITTNARLQVAAYMNAMVCCRMKVDCGAVVSLKNDEYDFKFIKPVDHTIMFMKRLREYKEHIAMEEFYKNHK